MIDLVTQFSPCREYRYTLWRQWRKDELFINRDRIRYVQFIGLNPSTADETNDDPTIRRCIAFAQGWGFDAMCMTNLFAFRATDPRNMKSHSKPIGDDNDRWLVAISRQAEKVIACWGNHGQFMARDRDAISLLQPMFCFGLTSEKQPKHPLYLRKDAQLVELV